MTVLAEPRVQIIARTEFLGIDVDDPFVPFDVDTDDGGSAVAEVAGRACYQSWHKPNPATATNAGYIAHIKDVGHGSVLEHGSFTVYIEGVSRAFTHELIRHRHLSYSQLSQRFVDSGAAKFVLPPLLRDAVAEGGRHDLLERFLDTVAVCIDAYDSLVDGLGDYLTDSGSPLDRTARRKAVREAARALMPNATETRIVVSGNYRAWHNYFIRRCTEHADAEIREVSLMLLEKMQEAAPNAFSDFQIVESDDGRLIARTEHSSL